ncbi:hypothetical protein ACP8H2_09565 [Bacillus subtilis]|uniref:hypothetical protein n=1 Tax=Bacillus subtilis TaxID=1423 RepID=UPI003CED89E8
MSKTIQLDRSKMVVATRIASDGIDLMSLRPSLSVVFHDQKNTTIRLEPNGDIYINEKLVTNDIEIVDSMRSLFHGKDEGWSGEYNDHEQELLEKDKKIKELEEYKYKYEQLLK